MDVDVLIVGGGPAGLSAALVLGRCHRRVLICDEGKQRNLASPAIHGLLGQEGTAPSDFLVKARAELGKYPTLELCTARVVEVVPRAESFEFHCEDGNQGTASKLLVASGIVDELPAIAGAGALYGTSVHHCLYCDGFEYRGKSVAAYGKGDKGAELGIVMRHWVSDVVVCSDGTEISSALRKKLEDRGIPMRMEKISRLAGAAGRLSRVEFVSGPPSFGRRSSSPRAAGRHPIYPNVSAVSAMKRAVSSSARRRRRVRWQASMLRATPRGTSSWSLSRLRKVRRRP